MDRITRVLMCDDDDIWIDFCAEKLGKKGYIVEKAYEVEEALRMIRDSFYDIVFVDIKMKFGNSKEAGFMVCERATDYLPQAKVISVTAYDSPHYMGKSFREIRSYDYLAKTGDVNQDVRKMSSVIERILQEWQDAVGPNPFHAQSGKDPEYTIGDRRRVIDELSSGELAFLMSFFENAKDGQFSRFLVTGSWGTGKSVLLRHFRRLLQKKGYYASYYEIPGLVSHGYSPLDVAGELLIGIINGFPMKIDVFQRFFACISKMGIKLKLPALEGTIEWQKQQTGSVPRLFREGIKSILTDLEPRSDVVVILLDDLQKLNTYRDVAEALLSTFHESIFQSKPLVFGSSYRITGSEGSASASEISDLTNRFFAGCKVSLTNFTIDEMSMLARHTLVGTGVTFDDEVIREVYRYTDGHPFFTQLFFHHLHEQQFRGRVSTTVFPKALKAFVNEASPFFLNLLGPLREIEEQLLRFMATSEKGYHLKAIQHNFVDDEILDMVSEADSLCKDLTNRGILDRDSDGRYFIKDYILKEYFSQSQK